MYQQKEKFEHKSGFFSLPFVCFDHDNRRPGCPIMHRESCDVSPSDAVIASARTLQVPCSLARWWSLCCLRHAVLREWQLESGRADKIRPPLTLWRASELCAREWRVEWQIYFTFATWHKSKKREKLIWNKTIDLAMHTKKEKMCVNYMLWKNFFVARFACTIGLLEKLICSQIW